MTMKKLVLIRHGITEGNKNRWYYGSTDLPLTEEGKGNLVSLCERGIYPKPGESAIYITTGLKRTEETLRIIYDKEPDKTLAKFKEMDFGVYECKSFEELACDEDFLKWAYDETGTVRLARGESRNDFSHRIKSGLEEILSEIDLREMTVVVCHGGVISAIMMMLFPEMENNVWDWMVDPGYGYEVHFDEGRPLGFQKLGDEDNNSDE